MQRVEKWPPGPGRRWVKQEEAQALRLKVSKSDLLMYSMGATVDNFIGCN